MTIEEAKEELKRYKFDQARIDEAIEDIEALKERAFKITSTLSDMPRGTSPIQDKKAEIVAKYVDKANEMAIYYRDSADENIMYSILSQEDKFVFPNSFDETNSAVLELRLRLIKELKNNIS